MGQFSIDFDFLSSPSVEGLRHSVYTVPSGHSGPTIANGIDLGYQSAERFKAMKVPQNIINKLVEGDLFGKCRIHEDPKNKKGCSNKMSDDGLKELVDKFNKSKNKLIPSEIVQLYTAFNEAQATEIANEFKKRTGVEFSKLDSHSQTIACSVFHHYGTNHKFEWPDKLMKSLADGKKEDAANILMERANDINHKYKHRRKTEAEYLSKSIIKK